MTEMIQDPIEQKRLELIHNEQVKLAAAATDRVSTGCYVVGCLAPSAKVMFDGAAAFLERPLWMWIIGQGAFFVTGAALAWRAKMILRRLR